MADDEIELGLRILRLRHCCDWGGDRGKGRIEFERTATVGAAGGEESNRVAWGKARRLGSITCVFVVYFSRSYYRSTVVGDEGYSRTVRVHRTHSHLLYGPNTLGTTAPLHSLSPPLSARGRCSLFLRQFTSVSRLTNAAHPNDRCGWFFLQPRQEQR